MNRPQVFDHLDPTTLKPGRAWSGRVEDEPLVRGLGRYTDDLRPAGAAIACFVRSPHAFAEIRGVDTQAARKVPGVLAILTAADLAAADYHSVSHPHPIPGRGGKMVYGPHRPALVGERAMHVGDPVAMVVAQTLAAAQEAADLVEVEYNPLTPVTDLHQALASGAPQLWPDAPGNIAFDWAAPPDDDGKKKAEIDRLFAEAAHVARVDIVNQRLVVASLEPRAAVASYDAQADKFTLVCGSQGAAQIRAQVAGVMGLQPQQLRVLTEDVGGGFGMKASGYPEYIVMLHAARELRRPMHWTSTRSEAFVTDNQGRDSLWTVELALDRRGKFLALRADGLANVGAYMTGVVHFCATLHVSGCLPTVYDIPAASVRSRCVMTNTVPIGAYRGAGRPEASYLLERVIDAAADKTGIDAVELRRRNLIKTSQFPYKTAFGNTYDSGDFTAVFEKALVMADHDGFKERRRLSKKARKLRGLGVGCYLEIAGAFPEEQSRISFPGGGKIVIAVGASSQGQGHLTVFRRVAADHLGVPEECITIQHGDSDRDVPGFGAVASRSAMYIGGAITRTIEAMLEKGRDMASLLMQAGEAEVEYRQGKFFIGNERSISLFQVAERAPELVRQGVAKESLDTTGTVKAPPSFPNGCHIAEVEIDPETGYVTIVRYTAVDDCGRLLEPVIVEGQIHGGIAQGVGQALTEATVYDAQSGQLLSGSFMDYAMPRAEVMPSLTVAHIEVPCRTNPLGVKGTGEAGTTAAPPTVINAIRDALPEGIKEIDMPATPERIFLALQHAAKNPSPAGAAIG